MTAEKAMKSGRVMTLYRMKMTTTTSQISRGFESWGKMHRFCVVLISSAYRHGRTTL